ncbi:MAG: acyl-CoA/acyl-ACP dehydrogenase [Actinobacteria bacterium]|nr:acyl-CoA/acyl-ACP dehydrogenase [Actinomycetota bacterium]
MDFGISDEQSMLRDMAREYLANRLTSEAVRSLMESERAHDEALWVEMAEMGWHAMAIPEEYGGAGFTFQELGIILEEMGRRVTPGPFFSTVVLGANALLLGGTEDQKQRLLPAVAAGDHRLAFALIDTGGQWSLDDVSTTARIEGSVVTLEGEKSFVIDGHTADTLIVAARDGDDNVDFWLVPRTADGVSARRVETLDMTRKQADVTFEGVTITIDDRLGGAGSGATLLGPLYDIAGVGLAYESVGGSQACLEMAVEYAKERKQFGRAIGSFQAVKHKCADMLVQVESAKSAAYAAGWAAVNDPDEFLIAAPLAKSFCSDAYFFCAAENIQVHGGIGFTWEHDAHLFFKRAKTNQLMFGDGTLWRAKLADRLGI